MSKVVEIDGVPIRVCNSQGKNSRVKRHRMVALWKYQESICPLCENPIDLTTDLNSDLSPTIDHIVPRSKGGKNTASNYQLVHQFCNGLKNNGDDSRAFSRWMKRSLTQKQVAKRKAGRRALLGMPAL